MKALKLVLLAALVSFGTMAFSETSKLAARFSIPDMLALSTAKHLPEVAYSIRSQIDPETFLKGNDKQQLVAYIKVDKATYKVYGTTKEWVDFFFPQRAPIAYERADKSARKTE
jgi:hypothetical protein